jgi:hypothetical protein
VIQIHSPRPLFSITYAPLCCCRLGTFGSNIGLKGRTSAACIYISIVRTGNIAMMPLDKLQINGSELEAQ